MKLLGLLFTLILLTGLWIAPDVAHAVSGSGIPPKRLLLIFPVIVLVIIGILLVKIKRK